MTSNLKKVHLFAQKPLNINDFKSETPKLAIVPANRYNCDIKYSYVKVCAKIY